MLAAGVLGLVVVACAPAAAGPTPLPTFTSPASPAAQAAPDGPPALLPECEEVLSRAEAPALLGLPVDGIGLTTVVGEPAPAVGRLARTTCVYTVAGPGGAGRGEVLRLTLGAFGDAAAAHEQSARNAGELGTGARAAFPVEMGAAGATAVERDDITMLLVSYDHFTVDLVIRPALVGSGPGGNAVALTDDLARRVLDRLAPSDVAEPTPTPGPSRSPHPP
jgi:hypothetical protein